MREPGTKKIARGIEREAQLFIEKGNNIPIIKPTAWTSIKDFMVKVRKANS